MTDKLPPPSRIAPLKAVPVDDRTADNWLVAYQTGNSGADGRDWAIVTDNVQGSALCFSYDFPGDARDDRLGLHLADAVAGAFFKACDKHDTGGCNPEFAKLFAPRMERYPDKNGGIISGYGLKLMPKMGIAKLDPDQAEIFRHYGYPKQWWAPAPNNRSGV